MHKEFIPYEQALELKELGFDEGCYAVVTESNDYHGCDLGDLDDMELDNSVRKYNGEPCLPSPLYQQALSWIYTKSNGQINITINGSDTTEERNTKLSKGIKDLWDIQNSKSNQ